MEIPDTGVSVGEVNHYLHNTLGHETHITGEIYHDASGIIVTARAGGNGGVQFNGAESDLDLLLQQAAENIDEQTQPYRYAIYVINKPSTLTYEQRWTRRGRYGRSLPPIPMPKNGPGRGAVLGMPRAISTATTAPRRGTSAKRSPKFQILRSPIIKPR